jgi:hypothetical protein
VSVAGQSSLIAPDTDSGNDLLDPLFVTFHLQEGLDLAQRQVLPVPQCHQLIESAQKLVRIAKDLPLVKGLADTGDNLGEEMQTVDVLKDIRLSIRDEDHVQLVQGLVHISHIVLLHCGVLGS